MSKTLNQAVIDGDISPEDYVMVAGTVLKIKEVNPRFLSKVFSAWDLGRNETANVSLWVLSEQYGTCTQFAVIKQEDMF